MTSHEWCCTSKIIAFVTICSKQKSGISSTDNMPASALDKVVIFAGEVLFERKSPTATKQEATSCEHIELRILGRPEIPCTVDEKAEKAFRISSLTKQVLSAPHKSMLIANFIKNHAMQATGSVEYYPMSLGNLERPEVLKIEDCVQRRKCLEFSKPGETYCGCGRVLQGTGDKVRKQAEQRISSRFTIYVPGI